MDKNETLQLYANEKIDNENNFKIENNKLTKEIQNLHHQIELSRVSQIFKASLFINYFYPVFYIIFRKQFWTRMKLYNFLQTKKLILKIILKLKIIN